MGFLIFSAIILIVSVIAYFVLLGNDVRTSKSAPICGVAFAVLMAVNIAWNGLVIVSPGFIGVPIWFGTVQVKTLGEGLHLVNPMFSVKHMDGRRFAFEFASGGEGGDVVSISADQNPLTVDVAFPFQLNPRMAWKVYQKIGDDGRFRGQLVSHARSAVRDGIAQFNWVPATTTERDKVALVMGNMFKRNVTRDLVSLGFDEEEANSTFTFMDVQLRKVLPDQRVLNAIAEKLAADQDLEKQETLTKIAEEVANRRANEGLGVAKLFAQLPAEFAPEQIAEILKALATKTRADAYLKAVETEQVDTIIFGGASAAVSATK